MSKARLVITSVTAEGLAQGDEARLYGVSRLLTRYRTEGESAFEPRSRRPKTSPSAISDQAAELIAGAAEGAGGAGLDAGPQTIAWRLELVTSPWFCQRVRCLVSKELMNC